MNNLIIKIKNGGLACICMLALFTSCNKLYTDPTPLATPTTPAGNTLAKTLAATASDSLYYRLVVKSGILTATPATITDSTLRFTMFVPDNNAMKVFISGLSGGALPVSAPDAQFSAFITANIPASTALPIVSYNIIPQNITTSSFTTSSVAMPNLQYPTIFNPAPTLSALLRLTTFPAKASSYAFVNNVPLSAADAASTNGIIHHTAAINLPPSASLWGRISTDGDMTYFKAAVLRADSGTAVAPSTVGFLQGALDNIGANLTTFVPTDSAMRAAITGLIAQGLIAQGVPPSTALAQAGALAATPAVFSNPALYPSVTAALVKGIVVYHILGNRFFTNNMTTAATNYYTLLSTAGPQYPGVTIQATFTGPIVTAATVKGKANSTASIILLDPTPSTGKSDQNATNGVLHKINQVLLPQ
ncbi:MAG: fasciclin domain-containing protein [Chitinophagaceae bacterium]